MAVCGVKFDSTISECMNPLSVASREAQELIAVDMQRFGTAL